MVVATQISDRGFFKKGYGETGFPMLVPSSLVRERTKLAGLGGSRWTPKVRRWYQRLLSGATHHTSNGRVLRVITLTTAPSARDLELNSSFQVLKKRILRKWPCRFDYWKLRTSEGNGVLHIIYSGIYIPVAWLKRNWREVHGGSYIVYIQKLRGKRKRMVNYLMGHYLPSHGERGIYSRMSWSWGWVFRGFAGAWKYTWKTANTFYEALYDWNKLMRRTDPLFYYKMKRNLLYEQTVLKKRGIMGTVVFSQVVS